MKLSDLFYINYGNGLSLNAYAQTNSGINFISRTSKNNGVSGQIEKLSDIKPFDVGLITVAVSGSVLESFIQVKPFYTGFHIMVLKPKKTMTLNQKLFYCLCIKRNKYKYSYGRQANTTLKFLEVPDQTPDWVDKFNISKLDDLTKAITDKKITLKDRQWKWFLYSDVFDIERGYYNKRPNQFGDVNFVSASAQNNGVTDTMSAEIIEKMYDGNCITVANNGQYTSCAFYQKNDFTCSHDVNILRTKDVEINPFIALFLIPLIRLEKYRFNYGRKWRYQRMQKTQIKLPVDKIGKPDWDFMQDYVKSTNFSMCLMN